jgi:hypothetical protein
VVIVVVAVVVVVAAVAGVGVIEVLHRVNISQFFPKYHSMKVYKINLHTFSKIFSGDQLHHGLAKNCFRDFCFCHCDQPL